MGRWIAEAAVVALLVASFWALFVLAWALAGGSFG